METNSHFKSNSVLEDNNYINYDASGYANNQARNLNTPCGKSA
jgi:hypothetical protein